jgi:cation:H+ antiporter
MLRAASSCPAEGHSMLLNILILAVGLVLLTAGAEALVCGASSMAARLGIPSLIVGLTIVAFGTSAPELAVSVGAAWSDQADIALGNVVGSNIFNVLFILGISALVVPLAISSQLIRIDVPLMIGASILVLLFALDGHIGRIDGAVLFAGLLAYIGFQIRQGLRERSAGPKEPAEGAVAGAPVRWWTDPLFVLGGLVLLVIGSRMLVASAVDIAQVLGVSELVIGLTIVAAGTSLPEVATSVVASLRGERDIAVGNVVGSNVFNLLGVLGPRQPDLPLRDRGRPTGPPVRSPGYGRRRRGLPADLRDGTGDRAVGGWALLRILPGLYDLCRPGVDTPCRTGSLRDGDALVRAASHGRHPIGPIRSRAS